MLKTVTKDPVEKLPSQQRLGDLWGSGPDWGWGVGVKGLCQWASVEAHGRTHEYTQDWGRWVRGCTKGAAGNRNLCGGHKGEKAQGPQTMQTKPSLCRTGKQTVPTRTRLSRQQTLGLQERWPAMLPPAGSPRADIPTSQSQREEEGAHKEGTAKTPSSWWIG